MQQKNLAAMAGSLPICAAVFPTCCYIPANILAYLNYQELIQVYRAVPAGRVWSWPTAGIRSPVLHCDSRNLVLSVLANVTLFMSETPHMAAVQQCGNNPATEGRQRAKLEVFVPKSFESFEASRTGGVGVHCTARLARHALACISVTCAFVCFLLLKILRTQNERRLKQLPLLAVNRSECRTQCVSSTKVCSRGPAILSCKWQCCNTCGRHMHVFRAWWKLQQDPARVLFVLSAGKIVNRFVYIRLGHAA